VLSAHLPAEPSPSSGGSLITLYYIIAILGAVGAVPIATIRFYRRQKARWQTDGEQHAKAIAAMEANTSAAAENTKAIGSLTSKLDAFADNVRDQFADVHSKIGDIRTRLTRVETQQNGGHFQGRPPVYGDSEDHGDVLRHSHPSSDMTGREGRAVQRPTGTGAMSAPVTWRDFSQAGLFGLIDGLNGMVGLVIGLMRVHTLPAVVFVALLARAGSSSVSMAGAQYESDDITSSRRLRWGRIAAMGCGYLTSALLPGAGFAVSTRVGLIVFIPATVVILAGITWFRSGRESWPLATATTLTIFVLAVGAGLLASLAG